MMRTWLFAAVLGCTVAGAFAADVPKPGNLDSRVRFVNYESNNVTVINIELGVVTRIVLGDDEKIAVGATGLAADCAKDTLQWCVRADVGSNQILVKPREGASVNNLELTTNQHDYSIQFRVVRGSAKAMYRVVFRYPPKPVSPAAIMAFDAARQQAASKALLQDRMKTAAPVIRNTHYTMQVLGGAADIAPSMVFDDGRFTYFQFPANREIPTIFYIAPTGEEGRVNFHMEGDLVVVQRMSRSFVLRLGHAVVGVWNEAFDPNGVAAVDGTTVPGVERVVRQGE